jgi:hypothetical protein
MSCKSIAYPRIRNEMRAFATKLVGDQPLPEWAESAMKQHAEYAAVDYCRSRGLEGLGVTPARPTFPSVQAVYDLIDGKEGAALDVAKWTAVRAGLIGAGLFIGGERSFKGIVVKSLIASLVVEGFVIGYIQYKESKQG